MKKEYWYYLAIAVALFLIIFKNKIMILHNLFVRYLYDFEGFSSRPYWDIKQWSWGYGTRVPGSSDSKSTVPNVSITKPEALAAAWKHVNTDYEKLKKIVKVELSPEQWAALLSFSYNLGFGNADNLVPNINNKNWSKLQTQWLSYVYADGKVNSHLEKRRAEEWKDFSNNIS